MRAIGQVGCRRCRRRVGHTRGLCPACYARLRKQVLAGGTSWAALEEAGLCRPPVPLGERFVFRKGV